MANGIATKAAHLCVGQTIGQYKGGKFVTLGKVARVVAGISATNVYVEGKRHPYTMHGSTIVRVV
jgi:hypothetical protein